MSDPSSSSLTPAADTTAKLTDTVNANVTITAYCHALLNTTIAPVPGITPPAWFNDLVTNLTIAQKHASIWLGTDANPGGLAATVFSTIPQSFIDYSNIFTLATGQVVDLLGPLGSNVPTADQHTQVVQLLGAVMTTLQTSKGNLQSVLTQIQTFAGDVQTDNTNLVTGQNGAAKAYADDEAQIATINAKINEITAKMQADSQKALASEIGLGVAIFVLVVAIALTVATDGAAAPLIVGGIALLGVGGAIAGSVIFSKDVNQDLEDLHEQQSELTAETQQAAALQGITNGVGALLTANQAAETAISTVLDDWGVLEAKLQSVLNDLQAGQSTTASALLDKLEIQASQTAWTQLTAFCTAMEQSSITVQKVVPPQTKAQLRAMNKRAA